MATTDQVRAYHKMASALRSFRLLRGKFCEECGAPGVRKPSRSHMRNRRTNWSLHAHHDDYSRPLDVVWLCPSCHRQHHVKSRAFCVDAVSCPKCGEPAGSLCKGPAGGSVSAGNSHRERTNKARAVVVRIHQEADHA